MTLKSEAQASAVVQACNHSNSGSRDQEDHGWKLAWANSS
jgi:hypothetical protein